MVLIDIRDKPFDNDALLSVPMPDNDEHNVGTMDGYIDLDASKGFDSDDEEDEYFDEGIFSYILLLVNKDHIYHIL